MQLEDWKHSVCECIYKSYEQRIFGYLILSYDVLPCRLPHLGIKGQKCYVISVEEEGCSKGTGAQRRGT